MRSALLSLLLLGACAGARPYDYSREPDPRRAEYIIGPADQLSVQVWKNPELSKDVSVRPDGTVTLPLIGDIKAAGQTPTQLREEIVRQLGRFVRGEGLVVTVGVTGVNSYTFTVSGNVERAGVYSSQRYVTVLEAIQLAGGPNRFASPGGIEIYRRDAEGKVRAIPIDYPALLAGRRPESNVAILAGDQINVP
ncbi:MAG: polysaccharide biosynthesis/export family protein [Deltaproteobacteria bacterium]|nr:polysaccharide biosynthesis/export family protein [Deltaproteobacteria bacterium]